MRNGLARANAFVHSTAKDQAAEVVIGDAALKDFPKVVVAMHLSMKVGLTQVDQRGI